MAEDKPVVESFQLDHTKVKAPYVRYIDTQTGPNGDVISNYDLRLVQPNENAIPTGGLHTIEHTIAVLLRDVSTVISIVLRLAAVPVSIY